MSSVGVNIDNVSDEVKVKEKKNFVLIGKEDSVNKEIDFEEYFSDIKSIEIFNPSVKLVKSIVSQPFKVTYKLFPKPGVYICKIEYSTKTSYCTVTYLK